MVWKSSKQEPGNSSSDKCTADPTKPKKVSKIYFKIKAKQQRYNDTYVDSKTRILN